MIKRQFMQPKDMWARVERFKFFRKHRPASVLIQVSRLGHPDAMVEIEVEAIIEPERLKAGA